MPAATPPPAPDDPLCTRCGGDVPLMAAIVYHGAVYHPACVTPASGAAKPPGETRPPAPPGR